MIFHRSVLAPRKYFLCNAFFQSFTHFLIFYYKNIKRYLFNTKVYCVKMCKKKKQMLFSYPD